MSDDLKAKMAARRAADAAKLEAETQKKKSEDQAEPSEPQSKLKKVGEPKAADVIAPKAVDSAEPKPKPGPSPAPKKLRTLSEQSKKATKSVKKWPWWIWILLIILLLLLLRYWSYLVAIIIGLPVIIIILAIAVAILYFLWDRLKAFWWLIPVILIAYFIAERTGFIQPPTRPMTAQEIADRQVVPTLEPTFVLVAKLNDPASCGKYVQLQTGAEVLIVKDGNRFVAFLRVVGEGGVIRYFALSPTLSNQSARDAAFYLGAFPPDQILSRSDYPLEKVDDTCLDIEAIVSSGVAVIYN